MERAPLSHNSPVCNSLMLEKDKNAVISDTVTGASLPRVSVQGIVWGAGCPVEYDPARAPRDKSKNYVQYVYQRRTRKTPTDTPSN